MTATIVTVRGVLLLLLEADAYPRQSNEDWRDADDLQVKAYQTAETAVDSLGDPPEFRQWLNALHRPKISSDEREDIYVAVREYLAGQARTGTF
jgi:hypothetical protein